MKSRTLTTPGQLVAARRTDLVHSRLRSEEHTSELQSPCNLVCRLLLEKKKIFSRDLNQRIWHSHGYRCALRRCLSDCLVIYCGSDMVCERDRPFDHVIILRHIPDVTTV